MPPFFAKKKRPEGRFCLFIVEIRSELEGCFDKTAKFVGTINLMHRHQHLQPRTLQV